MQNPAHVFRVRRQIVLSIVISFTAVLAFLAESWHLSPQLDDAYIIYRYARNLAEGNGLVYNLGEQVEGFTTLLWTLLVSLGIRAGFEARQVGHALGLVSGAATLALTYVYARAGLSTRRAWIAALAPWIVLSSTTFALWTTAGMETPLFAAALTGCFAAQARGRNDLAVALVAIASLTRPEGGLAAVVLFASLLGSNLRSARTWRLIGVYVLFLALLTSFRLGYFGSPVPNTFYAKVGGAPFSSGLRYTLGFFAAGAGFLVPPAVIAAWREPLLRPGAVLVFAFAAYTIAIGGDVFLHSRFLMPVLPILSGLAVRGVIAEYARDRPLGVVLGLCLPLALCWHVFRYLPGTIGAALAVAALVWLVVLRPGRGALFAACALASLLLGLAAFSGEGPKHGGLELSAWRRSAELRARREFWGSFERSAAELAARFAEEPGEVRLVGVLAIGAFGYDSRLPILDLFGLVDPVIAVSRSPDEAKGITLPGHQRSNAEYVLEREPDYLVIPRRPEEATSHPVRAVRDLWAHPLLDEGYEWDARLGAYRRREIASRRPSPPR